MLLVPPIVGHCWAFLAFLRRIGLVSLCVERIEIFERVEVDVSRAALGVRAGAAITAESNRSLVVVSRPELEELDV